ncbi:hypothetical protein PIROE2DRAFT_6369 [Piromyces sp. E2]|nr:hypothetical protein PIROE2DRAFT_6369 [Piromyces sp. E2]|eukprot:OUM66422.1 hypothetical protein PIROE2DRAFT_6369 [Piromyces sp. E2]
MQDLVSGEHPKLDLSIKSHSCTKLDELNNNKKDLSDSQFIPKESLKTTNSLPNINKKLINDIFVNLLINEQKTNSKGIDLNKINIINIDSKTKNRKYKYFSGCSNIKNTGYMSYDIKKTTVDVNQSSQVDIVSSGNNVYAWKDFLTIKSKRKITW